MDLSRSTQGNTGVNGSREPAVTGGLALPGSTTGPGTVLRKLQILLVKAVGEAGAAGDLRLIIAARCVADCEDGEIRVGISPATKRDPAEAIYAPCSKCEGRGVGVYEDGGADFEIALSCALETMDEGEVEAALLRVEALRRDAEESRRLAFTRRPFECSSCHRLYDVRLLCGCAVCGEPVALRRGVA